MTDELVSVIIPVCGVDFFEEALDSILEQTYQNIEVIVVDGSDDDSVKELLRRRGHDDRIKYFYREKNGIADALNYGLEQAMGDYVARMDADDISLPNRIEEQIAYLRVNEDVDVVGADYRVIDKNGKQLDERRLVENNEEIQVKLIFENPICHPTVMFRKNVLNAGWRYSKAFTEDYELWTRMIIEHKFANVPKVLLEYRVHGENLSKTAIEKVRQSSAKCAKEYLENLLQMDTSHYEEYDFTKNYYLLHMSKDEIGSYDNFLKKQLQLLFDIYGSSELFGDNAQKLLLSEIQKRWKLLIEASNLLSLQECLDINFAKSEFADSYGIVDRLLEENQKQIQKLQASRLSILLYGFGERGHKTLERLKCILTEQQMEWKLQGIIDKRAMEYEFADNMYTTISKENANFSETDYVLVSSHVFFEEIKEELMEMGVQEEKIIRDNLLYYI